MPKYILATVQCASNTHFTPMNRIRRKRMEGMFFLSLSMINAWPNSYI